jgi:outer membrane receptor for ferric coprogen and ferric-rhodotorulic acid
VEARQHGTRPRLTQLSETADFDCRGALSQQWHIGAGYSSTQQNWSKNMNETRTTSILNRVPKILAVTAASYGLPQQAQAHSGRAGGTHRDASKVAAPQPDRADREIVALHA